MNDILYGLNESQKKAVTTTEGPVMIIAGPGTGKTLTIVRRISYLIHKGTNPERILGVTFTNRAANEMKKRAEDFLGKNAHKVFIGTFHLLGLRIIQDFFKDSFIIINRDEQENILKGLIKKSGMKLKQVAEKISRIKNYTEYIDDSIKTIFEKYQNTLKEKNAFDFDDLICKSIDILSDNDNHGKYKDAFEYIMVDEYQDINPAQYRLLKLLTPKSRNLCVIGDSDQAIYAFRGADVTNFLNFDKDYTDVQKIALVDNYRSTGIIIEASNELIKNNLKRIERKINPLKDTGLPIRIISLPDEKAEGKFIIKEIERMIGGTSHYQMLQEGMNIEFSGQGFNFSDFAVLFRSNAQAQILEETFSLSGIPYQVIGKPPTINNKIINELKKLSPVEFYNKVIENISLKADSGDPVYIVLQNIALQYQYNDFELSDMFVKLIQEIKLITPADIYNSKSDAVTLMTLHMSKGLEFRVVFITGVEEGLIPYNIKKDVTDIEEERRLFYVGMTRAKDELFLTNTRSRFIYGHKHPQSPSPFLREIPEKFISNVYIPDKIDRIKKDGQIGLFTTL
ncbi:MAG: UvrD-helicase domain-containing protein [Nitrospirae bacterium]|nr:UvrD-helicase domain-containing protein [Nitrospirota bacterium]